MAGAIARLPADGYAVHSGDEFFCVREKQLTLQALGVTMQVLFHGGKIILPRVNTKGVKQQLYVLVAGNVNIEIKMG